MLPARSISISGSASSRWGSAGTAAEKERPSTVTGAANGASSVHTSVPAVEPAELRLDTVPERVRTVGDPAADIDAHAASLALSQREDVLRVLMTASPQTRRRQLASALGVDEKEAARAIKRSDAGRARLDYSPPDSRPASPDPWRKSTSIQSLTICSGSIRSRRRERR